MEIAIHKISEAIPDKSTLSALKQTLAEHEHEADEAYNQYEKELRDIAVAKTYNEMVPVQCVTMPRILYADSGDEARKVFYSQLLTAWDRIKSGTRTTLVIHGNSGIGKTYAACWMIHEALYTEKKHDSYGAYYMSARYITARELADRYKQCESFDAKTTKKRVLHEYISCDLLVVDEVARIDSANEHEALFDIADTCTGSIILITNLDKMKTMAYLGTAIVDRLTSSMMKIDTDNLPSWRK